MNIVEIFVQCCSIHFWTFDVQIAKSASVPNMNRLKKKQKVKLWFFIKIFISDDHKISVISEKKSKWTFTVYYWVDKMNKELVVHMSFYISNFFFFEAHLHIVPLLHPRLKCLISLLSYRKCWCVESFYPVDKSLFTLFQLSTTL